MITSTKGRGGRLFKYTAVALISHQIYRRYLAPKLSKHSCQRAVKEAEDSRLDSLLEDTFPASDPLPLSRTAL